MANTKNFRFCGAHNISISYFPTPQHPDKTEKEVGKEEKTEWNIKEEEHNPPPTGLVDSSAHTLRVYTFHGARPA